MADERISSFVTDEAISELLKVEGLLESVTQSIVAANASAKKAEGWAAQAKSMEEVAKSANAIAAAHKQLEKNTAIADRAAAAAKKLADAEARAALETQRKAAVNKVAEDSLKKLSDTLNAHRKSYELLTAAERENANIGGTLLTRIQELDRALKASDASMGRFNRNVGNYTGATKELRGSITQIARELPALGNGFQTFTMAIGNNIAPAAEAIRRFREEQALLRAEGKPTESVFKALGAAIFNWQTALLLGVTLLITYSKEIKEFVTGTKEAVKATQDLAKYQQQLNENIQFTNNRLSAQNRLLEAQAKNRGASAKELAAVEQAGFKERLDNQDAFIKESIDNEIHYASLLTKVQGGIKVTKPGTSEKFTEQELTDLLEKARRQTSDLTEIRNDIRAESQIALINAQTAIAEADKKAASGIAKETEQLNDKLQQLRQTIAEFSIALKTPNKAEIDQAIKDLQSELDSSNFKTELEILTKFDEEEAKKKADNLLEVLNRHIATKKGGAKKGDKKKELTPEEEADLIFQDAMQLSGELNALQEAVAGRRIQQLDSEIKKINEKRDADVLAIQASMLGEEEKQRRIAEINIQANEQEKRIEREKIERKRRAAIFERGIAIAQIIANTAKAIVEVLPNYVLAALNGAIGAAQLATVFAAPLPAYEEGTKGKAHKGGKAIMFEGGKAEAVFEPGKTPWIGTREGVYDLAPGSHVMSNKELMSLANMYTLGMPALIPQNGHMLDSEGIKQGLKDVQRAIESKPSSDTYWTWQGVVNQTRINGNTLNRLHNLRH